MNAVYENMLQIDIVNLV